MRIAHLLRAAQGGMRAQVASLLDDPAVETWLAAPPETLQSLGRSTPRAGFPLPLSDRPADQIRAGIAAGRWVCTTGAELIHGHGLARAPLYALAARRARTPLIVTLHNLVPTLTRAERIVLRLALRRADAVIAVSDAVAKSARSLVACKRLRVIYNGVDQSRFDALPEPTAARRALGIDDAPTVAVIARLAPEKGIDMAIEAVQGLGSAQLIVAGDGPERAALTAMAHDRVRFLGRRDDIEWVLAAADVVAVPSRAEGLGLTAIEAQMAGRPVVASRIGGLPEVIDENQTGLLIAPGDVAALCAALGQLLGDPARRAAMGAAGRQRACERFSEARCREATRALYGKVREGARRR